MPRKIQSTSIGKTLVAIPARMDSKRLPSKPMLMAAGKPLVQWTYERAKQTKADHVVVTTSDWEVTSYCAKHGLSWMLTESYHPNGTSRVAELLAKLKPDVRTEIRVVVNWQVDEPLIEPEDANHLLAERVNSIGTLVCLESDLTRTAGLKDPNTVKVTWSQGRCHWFSRAPMQGAGFHVGAYSFSPFLLGAVGLLRPSRLALAESLEQLAWVESGYTIYPIEITRLPLSINDERSWEQFKAMKEREN